MDPHTMAIGLDLDGKKGPFAAMVSASENIADEGALQCAASPKKAPSNAGTTREEGGPSDTRRSGLGEPSIPPQTMRNLAWMQRRQEEDISNSLDERISKGVVRGMNNKAKAVIHQ